MTPKFKNGDYDGGITDGVRTIIDVLEGGELQQIENQYRRSQPVWTLEDLIFQLQNAFLWAHLFSALSVSLLLLVSSRPV